jgi:hypothetical protein
MSLNCHQSQDHPIEVFLTAGSGHAADSQAKGTGMTWNRGRRGAAGAARGAICIGMTAAVLAAGSTAYACTTTANAGARHGFGATALLTPNEVAAIKSAIAAQVAALNAAKAAKVAALKAHDAAAAAAAAKRLAAARAAIKARVAAALAVAKARAEALRATRAAARASNKRTAVAADGQGRHHCDGSRSGANGGRFDAREHQHWR